MAKNDYLCTQYLKKGISYGFIYCRQNRDGRFDI